MSIKWPYFVLLNQSNLSIMKKILFLVTVMLLIQLTISAQCFYRKSMSQDFAMYQPTEVRAAFVIDKSALNFGVGVHAGIFADHIGVFLGYVEYKLPTKYNEATNSQPADRIGCLTLAANYRFFNEKLVIIPYFAFGTQNYQDPGVRVAFDAGSYGIIGVIVSRTMGIGATFVFDLRNR